MNDMPTDLLKKYQPYMMCTGYFNSKGDFIILKNAKTFRPAPLNNSQFFAVVGINEKEKKLIISGNMAWQCTVNIKNVKIR